MRYPQRIGIGILILGLFIMVSNLYVSDINFISIAGIIVGVVLIVGGLYITAIV
jgi:hypothetical protein